MIVCAGTVDVVVMVVPDTATVDVVYEELIGRVVVHFGNVIVVVDVFPGPVEAMVDVMSWI